MIDPKGAERERTTRKVYTQAQMDEAIANERERCAEIAEDKGGEYERRGDYGIITNYVQRGNRGQRNRDRYSRARGEETRN
jgi:hypothetical protein